MMTDPFLISMTCLAVLIIVLVIDSYRLALKDEKIRELEEIRQEEIEKLLEYFVADLYDNDFLNYPVFTGEGPYEEEVSEKVSEEEIDDVIELFLKYNINE